MTRRKKSRAKADIGSTIDFALASGGDAERSNRGKREDGAGDAIC